MTDSELRTKNPFATISLEKLIGAAMDNVPFDCADFYEHRFELSCVERPDVATRRWYTLSWTGADGKRHHVSASKFGLLLWRAAAIELQTRESDKQA